MTRNKYVYGLVALLLVVAVYFAMVRAGTTKGEATSGIEFRQDEAAAIAEAKASGKPVMIDFMAEWCGACHEIDAQVFSNPQVQERVKAFVALRLDVTSESPENLSLLQKYGVQSLPAIIFLDKDGKVLEKPRINGLLTPDEFLTVISGL